MIRAFVVDDSATVRRALSDELSQYAGIEVVGTAPDPFVARNRIVKLDPDVVLLDVEMPRMDGLTFLRKLMRFHPVPVVIVSSITPAGSAKAIEALEAGAVEVLCKPGPGDGMAAISRDLVNGVRAAARARRAPVALQAPARPVPAPRVNGEARSTVVAVGASTGGPQAVRSLLQGMPENGPPILIVQHMPGQFTGAFARRLNDITTMTVMEATDGLELRPGLALVAPGDRHLVLNRAGSRLVVGVKDGPRVGRHRPSVDVLFKSVARSAGSRCVGVLLTGMGSDGAQGLAELHSAGAATVAQDEATCAVYGMPREAVRLGAVDRVLPIHQIASAILEMASIQGGKSS